MTTPGRLVRVLGFAFAAAVSIGGTIGPGILRSPGLVAAEIGEPWLIHGAWILGGLYALLGTWMVAELAVTYPESGGLYVYPRIAFGPGAGFAIGWSDWLATCASAASIAVTAAEFAAELWTAAQGREAWLAAGLVALFCAFQSLGIRLSARAQQVFAAAQAGAMLALAAACFLAEPASAPARGATHGGLTLAGLALAMRFIIVDYDGWYTAVYFAEEDTNPARNIPRGMILGVLVVIAVYLLINAAFLHVVPAGELARARLASSEVASRVFPGTGARIVSAVAALASAAVLGPMFLTTTRILYGLARDGMFVAAAAGVSRGGTPELALWTSGAATVAMIASGTYEQLIAVGAVLFVVNYLASFVALHRLRRRDPATARPWTAPGQPWTNLAAIGLSAAYLGGVAANDWANSLAALALLAAAAPLYKFARRNIAS